MPSRIDYALLLSMALSDHIRPFYRVLKKRVKWAIAKINSFKYRNFNSRNHTKYEYTGNLLVVKEPIYAELAKLCAESFLFFNPKCKVIINVDSATEIAVSKAFKSLAKKRNVEIKKIDRDHDSWQDIKLGVILESREEDEFFMDADLRWNGPIPHLAGVTFFVNEFKLKTNPTYSKLLESNGWLSNKDFTMKNTSFLYWGDYKPADSDKAFISQAMNRIQELCNIGVIPPEDAVSISRISEQIALSVFVDVRNLEVNFLKAIDGYRDGSFVESSYFGATGSAF
jgi:hypothetical protein